MATIIRLANRVKMTVSGTPGTGNITLGSAVPGFQSFSQGGISNLHVVRYMVEDGLEWEYGYGLYTGGTLHRKVLESSNVDLPVNLTSAAIVSITIGKEDFYGLNYMWVPADYMLQTPTGPARNLTELTPQLITVSTLDFDTSIIEHAHFQIGMPPSYDGGSVTFIPLWSHVATVTNFNVSWKMGAMAFEDGDLLGPVISGFAESADTGGTANTLYFGPESVGFGVTGAPTGAPCYAFFDIYRDGADTQDNLAVDARLHGVYILFNTNTTQDNQAPFPS